MLPDSVITGLDQFLRADDEQRSRLYPGGAATRQAVHTVYVPADRFGADTITAWGTQALASLDTFGPLPHADTALTDAVRAKLAREPIEDLRIDFEDGFGNPGDPAEDESARSAATAVAAMSTADGLPAFIGLRMKSLEPATRARAVRTVDLFLHTLLDQVALPAGFRITLPKVTSVAQVQAMVELCTALESSYAINRLSFELQIETPQAVLGADGTVLLAPMLHAAAGRCVGLHYGTYDYSAALGIAAPYQSMEHPAADQAKALMQVAVAGTGVTISDGSTNVLPLGDADAVHAAWRLHYRLVRRSLERGFYQGWDLHPAQLPTRFAATFAFYQEGLVAAAARVRAYVERSESSILDEPATAVALAGYLLRGLDAGALAAPDVQGASGLSVAQLAVLGRRTASAAT